MDRDMVNCLHYLYQWGRISKARLDDHEPFRRLFWCDPDTRHPLIGSGIIVEDPQTGDLSLNSGVYDLIDRIENQLRTFPRPDYAFGFPVSADVRSAGARRPAFLAIPYSGEFVSVKETVLRAADAVGFDCEVTGDLAAPGTVMDHVWQGIRGADVVIADLTGRNPNVFYEIGLAHALGKEVILMTQDDEAPFDVRHSRHISYRVDELEALTTALENALNAVSARYPHEGDEPRF